MIALKEVRMPARRPPRSVVVRWSLLGPLRTPVAENPKDLGSEIVFGTGWLRSTWMPANVKG